MTNSLFYQALRALTPLERKHLGQWMASPYFAKKTTPLALYEYCCQCIEQKKDPDRAFAIGLLESVPPARAYVRKKTSKAQKNTEPQSADEQALRSALSELLGHLERYIVYEAHFNDTAQYKTRLAAAYRRRGLQKHYTQTMTEARKAWSMRRHHHAEYLEGLANLEYEYYQHLSGGRRTEELNLQAVSDRTDSAFMAQKLRQACFAVSHQNVYKATYDFGLLHSVLDFVAEQPALQKLPAIGLYYYCYRFLTEPDNESWFHAFKVALFEAHDTLPDDEQRNLHLLAINYCIKRLNQLNTPYFKEALDLYKSALRGGFLIENGQFSHFAFNNIVAIAIKVQEDHWAEQFVHEYVNLIEKKHRDAAYHLNLARIDYLRGRMREAMLHLQEADYKDLLNNLIAKTLQLKIYYESGEIDALDAHLQNMQTFIRRQHGLGYHKTNYLSVLRFTRKLMRLRPSDTKERMALRQEIEGTSGLMEKEWLLAQLSR
jgi:hypothetical protein